jgi:hypothetical protein
VILVQLRTGQGQQRGDHRPEKHCRRPDHPRCRASQSETAIAPDTCVTCEDGQDQDHHSSLNPSATLDQPPLRRFYACPGLF